MKTVLFTFGSHSFCCKNLPFCTFSGTTKIKNLHDNVGAVKVKLTKQDLQEISDAVPINEVAGESINEVLAVTNWKFANTPPLSN